MFLIVFLQLRNSHTRQQEEQNPCVLQESVEGCKEAVPPLQTDKRGVWYSTAVCPEPVSVPGPSELQNASDTEPAVPEPASVPDFPDWRPTTSESAVSCTLIFIIFKVLLLCNSNITYFNTNVNLNHVEFACLTNINNTFFF